MPISDYLSPKLTDLVLSNTTFPPITAVFAALHTADPGRTCTAAPLASCARMAVVFNLATTATGAMNATTVDFVTSATGTITHLSLWDGSATATANALWYGSLATSKNVNAGDTIRLTSAQLNAKILQTTVS